MKPKHTTWLYFGLILMLGLFITLLIVTTNPIAAEWWTIHISRTYHVSLAWLFAWIPFSVMEMIFVSWIGLVILWFIKLVNHLRHRQWKQLTIRLSQWGIIIMSMVNLYVGTAGVAYQRLPLPIPQYQGSVLLDQYVPIVSYFREDFNLQANQLNFRSDGSVINPHSLKALNALIHAEFLKLDTDYFTAYSTTIKPLLTSFLYREFQIIGVHFAPTTEALINTLIPDALIPFTMAHELAHAKGVMREEDANLVAMYICLNSSDPFIRYSGYFNTFYALLNLTRYMGDASIYGQMVNQLNAQIIQDYQFQYDFWQTYDRLDRFATWVNDTYLRLFGNEGVSSYTDTPEVTTIEEGENTIEIIASFSPYQQLYFYYYFT
jgi:hypothetical protein